MYSGSAYKVLLASGKAACKLVLICGLISWMTATERLPAETPVVLSKLAFNLVLPAFLCSKVATTMASPTATLSLAVLPLLAIVQVAAGALLGSVCANVVCQMNRSMASGTQGYVQPADVPTPPLSSPATTLTTAVELMNTSSALRMLTLQLTPVHRWHPTRPAASAESLAAATATAVGLPASGFSKALIPKEDKVTPYVMCSQCRMRQAGALLLSVRAPNLTWAGRRGDAGGDGANQARGDVGVRFRKQFHATVGVPYRRAAGCAAGRRRQLHRPLFGGLEPSAVEHRLPDPQHGRQSAQKRQGAVGGRRA